MQPRLPEPIKSNIRVGIRLKILPTFLSLFLKLTLGVNNLQGTTAKICPVAILDLASAIPDRHDNIMGGYNKKRRKVSVLNNLRFLILNEIRQLGWRIESKCIDLVSLFWQIIICYCCKYNNVTFIRIQQPHEIGLAIFE